MAILRWTVALLLLTVVSSRRLSGNINTSRRSFGTTMSGDEAMLLGMVRRCSRDEDAAKPTSAELRRVCDKLMKEILPRYGERLEINTVLCSL